MKVIQINTSSLSIISKNYENDIYDSWYARVAYQLKKFYPKLEIECWTPEKEYKTEKQTIHNGIKFRVFPSSFHLRHGMDVSFDMVRALKKEQAKNNLILHIHEPHTWMTYFLLNAADKDKTKIICQHHGGRNPLANMMKYKLLLLGFPIFLGMQLCENLLFKKVRTFYSLSDQETRYLRKISKSEIKFSTMGIGEEYFGKQNKLQARKNLKFDKDKKYVLYIGRIIESKGVGELIDAAKKLENCEILIIGEGDLKYRDYVKNNQISNVKFLGGVFGKKKIDYLDACDCFVLPSYTEGAPVVLMEAIARNLPVIASDVGGIRKMIQNGREGIIIHPMSSEEIVQAVNKVIRWKKNIKKSLSSCRTSGCSEKRGFSDIRGYADKYKWERIIGETYKDYEK